MPSSSRPAWLAGTGAGAIALAALIASAALLGTGAPRAERTAHDALAAEALVAAYRRSRVATYTADSIFYRRLRTGREFTTSTRVVQRPPDRLVIGPASVDGEVGGARVGCSRPDGGEWRCRRGGGVDYDAEVQRDTEVLRNLVTGGPGRRAYRVARRGEDCFHLALTVAAMAPPYGREATMCFDAATGALLRVEVRRAEGIDRTTASRLSGAVDPADLQLPGPFQGG